MLVLLSVELCRLHKVRDELWIHLTSEQERIVMDRNRAVAEPGNGLSNILHGFADGSDHHIAGLSIPELGSEILADARNSRLGAHTIVRIDLAVVDARDTL